MLLKLAVPSQRILLMIDFLQHATSSMSPLNRAEYFTSVMDGLIAAETINQDTNEAVGQHSFQRQQQQQQQRPTPRRRVYPAYHDANDQALRRICTPYH
jgi:hypothetical protein